MRIVPFALSLACAFTLWSNSALAQSATLPFTEDFEGASPLAQSFWAVTGTNDFRTQVTSSNGPHGGTFHATMDDSVDGGSSSRNELTLTVDLSAASNVVLTFWAIGFDEETNGPPTFGFVGGEDFDGVAISQDGTTWYEIADLRSPGNFTSSYSQISVNLDQEIFLRSIPISFNSTFRIRFNQFDNWGITFDGIGIDDIAIQEVIQAVTVDTLATNDNSPELTGTINDNTLTTLADAIYDVQVAATDTLANADTDATTV